MTPKKSQSPFSNAAGDGAHAHRPLLVFGWDISKYDDKTKFIICTTGIFLCYFVYGYIQEYMFKRMSGFTFGWYLTLIQFIIYVSLIKLHSGLQGTEIVRRAPLQAYFWIAFFSVATMGLSNKSVAYLNYPTQVLFKSCKIVPVMLVGIVYLRKRYKVLDYVAVVLITAGLIFFSLGDNHAHGAEASFNRTGIILILSALVADALIGNVQEKIVSQYHCSSDEMIFFCKGIGSLYLLVICTLTGELLPAIEYGIEHPEVYLMMLSFSVVGCIGEFFVMVMVERFGALLTVTTTSCRKAFTIIISFVLFPKPFTPLHLFGVVAVFGGIAINIYTKNRADVDRLIAYYCRGQAYRPVPAATEMV